MALPLTTQLTGQSVSQKEMTALIVTCVALVVVFAICLSRAIPTLEIDLEARGHQAVHAMGLSDVRVRFEGREAMLTGWVDKSEQVAQARALIASMRGVRWVQSTEISVRRPKTLAVVQPVVPEKLPARFSLLRTKEGEVKISGWLDAHAASTALAATQAAFPGVTVIDQVQIVSTVGRPKWDAELPQLLGRLALIKDPHLELDGVTTQVTGVATPAQEKRIRSILATFDDPQLHLKRPSPAPRLQSQLDALNRPRLFSRRGRRLTRSGRKYLRRVAQILRATPHISVTVESHTNSRGPARKNLRLSQRRADAVCTTLAKWGVGRARLRAVGMGETAPIGDNRTSRGRAANRRVTLVVDLGEE